MLDRGKFLIIFIVLLALAAAGFSVWFRIEQGRRALALWGAEHAARIRNAPQVELMRLADGEDTTENTLTDPQGGKWHSERTVEVAGIPDFVHVRRALLDDSFFEQPTSPQPPAKWKYALRFRDDSDAASTLLFDGEGGEVGLLETSVQATMNAGLLNSIRKKSFDRFLRIDGAGGN